MGPPGPQRRAPGTAPHPPEAIEGRNTDGRSDLYSLGVLFFEALAGRRPFLADTPFGILRKHLTEPPPALATLRPGIPADLEAVVQRLLSKTPEERYAGAEELVLAEGLPQPRGLITAAASRA